MIVVAKPAAGARVTSPVRVAGTANVFEATVTVQVLDSNGQVLGKTFTTATCGTGCRGSYSVPVTFKVDQEQRGTIVVSDDDAAGRAHRLTSCGSLSSWFRRRKNEIGGGGEARMAWKPVFAALRMIC